MSTATKLAIQKNISNIQKRTINSKRNTKRKELYIETKKISTKAKNNPIIVQMAAHRVFPKLFEALINKFLNNSLMFERTSQSFVYLSGTDGWPFPTHLVSSWYVHRLYSYTRSTDVAECRQSTNDSCRYAQWHYGQSGRDARSTGDQ